MLHIVEHPLIAEELTRRESQWERERELVDAVIELRGKIAQTPTAEEAQPLLEREVCQDIGEVHRQSLVATHARRTAAAIPTAPES